MERPHHRYRIVAALRSLLDAAQERLLQQDEEKLESFAFLQQAGEDISGELQTAQKRMKKGMAAAGLAALLLFLLAALFGGKGESLEELLQRRPFGEASRDAPLHLTLVWEEETWEEDLELSVPARALTQRNAKELFDACETWLLSEVFGSRQDLQQVTKDLRLPVRSADGLVEIAWSSSDPGRISEEGRVDLIGCKAGQTVELSAALLCGDFSRELVFSAVLAPQAAKDLRASLEEEARRLVQDLPQSLSEESQLLPASSPYGAEAAWSARKEGLPWEIAGALLLVWVFLLFSRADGLKSRLKRQKGAFEREIPNMSLQMILLLDAGLTVDAAFARLLEEKRQDDGPLYRALTALDSESRSMNVPFVNALYVYARQSGIRDLIRFSTLALDCSGRGSELAEKLDRERQQLYAGRLNQAKAKAREAETKLCLPLMILLLVLVVIAIAPALLEM